MIGALFNLLGDIVDGYIDCGDCNGCYISQYVDGHILHKYDRNGVYVVHIYGEIRNIDFMGSKSLHEISQWGALVICSGRKMFAGCALLSIITQIPPNLQYVTDLSNMFEGCFKLNGDFSQWNVSEIIDMGYMFAECKSLTSELSNWNVSNVTNMIGMFEKCVLFNSNIGQWNVSNVEDMSFMFANCISFSSDISNWNVSRLQKTVSMFHKCIIFNSDLSQWDIKNATDISGMFWGLCIIRIGPEQLECK